MGMIWRGTAVSESPHRLQQPVRDGPWFIAGYRGARNVVYMWLDVYTADAQLYYFLYPSVR